jgi:stage II sporulation protein D
LQPGVVQIDDQRDSSLLFKQPIYRASLASSTDYGTMRAVICPGVFAALIFFATASSAREGAQSPEVRVRLASLGAPERVTLRLPEVARVTDAATGEALPVDSGTVAVTASGERIRFGVVSAGAVRVSAPVLTVQAGRVTRSYPDALVFSVSGSRLRLVNECSLEDYVGGVLVGECPASFRPEAIKAMAIAARSYTLRRAEALKASGGLCDTTHCQVYRGVGSVPASIREAVRATAGLYALYDGAVIDAVYCSDCGGHTEANEAVWEGSRPIPYLRPVPDAPAPGEREYCAINRSHSWSLTVPLERLRTLFGKPAAALRLVLAELSASGRVRRVGIAPPEAVPAAEPEMGEDPDREGGAPPPDPCKPPVMPAVVEPLKLFSGREWRDRLGLSSLRSLLFDVKETDVGVELRGRGYGHGVGLCQFGAQGMALQGKSFQEILKHYYTGITVGPVSGPGD